MPLFMRYTLHVVGVYQSSFAAHTHTHTDSVLHQSHFRCQTIYYLSFHPTSICLNQLWQFTEMRSLMIIIFHLVANFSLSPNDGIANQKHKHKSIRTGARLVKMMGWMYVWVQGNSCLISLFVQNLYLCVFVDLKQVELICWVASIRAHMYMQAQAN